VELYADVFGQNFGLESVLLRYANVYGPRQDASGEGGVVAIFADAMLQGREVQIHGDGYNLRDYVYVKDVARANLLALTHPRGDAFNIGTGTATSTNDLCAALAKATGWTRSAKHGVPRLGDLKKSVLDPSKAAKGLGWKPAYGLADGLRETVEWFRTTRP
jgi:UDP-glucose 4-epimerase